MGERVSRLLVPLLFGTVALLPPTLYLYTRTVPALAAHYPSFLRFYPHYFLPDAADLTLIETPKDRELLRTELDRGVAL